MKKPARRPPLIEVRHSPIHGYGVFAARRIRKGTTIIEYLGDRVSHEEADLRYEDKDPADNHTFLFTVDSKTVIDAGKNGNEARYINHGCDPNCESTVLGKRVYVEAIRTIQPGEELSYDYQIQRDADDAANVDEIFACRCGAPGCRGSMLEPRKKTRAGKASRGKVGARGKGRARSKAGGARGNTRARSRASARSRAGVGGEASTRRKAGARSKSTTRGKAGARKKSRRLER